MSFFFKTDPVPLSILGLVQVLICCWEIYKHSPIKLPLGIFFLSLIYILHSGYALLFLQGYSFVKFSPGIYTISDYWIAQIFTELSIFLFTVGYTTSKVRVNLSYKTISTDNVDGRYFWAFFLLCFPLYVAFIFSKISAAREMGYLATYQVSSNPLFHYGIIFINSCIPFTTLLFVIYRKNITMCKCLAVVMLLLSVYSMASGQRIIAVTGIISLGVIYFNVVSTVNKKNLIIIAATVVLFIIFLPIISKLRTYGHVDVENISDTFGDMRGEGGAGFLYDFIIEFGDTVISLIFPILKTGESAPYGFGLTYLLAPLSISPVLPGFLVESDFYKDAVFFITKYPEAAQINFGGSILGEAYANFGWLGCLVLFFVGVLIRTIDNSIHLAKKGLISYYSLLLIFVIPSLLRWTRDSFGCVFGFVFVILYFLLQFSLRKRKKIIINH